MACRRVTPVTPLYYQTDILIVKAFIINRSRFKHLMKAGHKSFIMKRLKINRMSKKCNSVRKVMTSRFVLRQGVIISNNDWADFCVGMLGVQGVPKLLSVRRNEIVIVLRNVTT